MKMLNTLLASGAMAVIAATTTQGSAMTVTTDAGAPMADLPCRTDLAVRRLR